MGYYKDLQVTAEWLASIQRPDNGWGLAPGQGSSLVNTSEAIYVLHRAGQFEEKIQGGLNYLEQNMFSHLETLGPRIRYAAFSLLGLCEHPAAEREPFVKEACEWLESARNLDNGWSQEAGTAPSELFSTFLALWALRAADWPLDRLEGSFQWLIAQAKNVGWALQPGHGPSPVGTAYALLALAPTSYRRHERVEAGKEFLLQTRQWGMEEEVIAGTVWKHCTYAWVIPALLQFDENPYTSVIAEGVRYINSVKSRSGGWNETDKGKGRTVRAQYWAVLAHDSIARAFDPAIHVLRIDAERAQEVLSEPEFVKIAVHSRWAMIFPSLLYKVLVYTLLLFAPLALMGFYRNIASAPPQVDALLSLASVGIAWLLIKKRHRYFPQATRIFKWLIATLAALSLLLGVSARIVAVKLREIIYDLFGGLIQ